MRIRKHAKISNLLYTTSSLKPGTPIQTHINCQLNQSPWDVMTFSPPSSLPPPSQLDGDFIYGENMSSLDSIQVVERDEFSGGYKGEYSGGGTTATKAEPPVVLCGKTDGKSWQCRREASKGNSLCEHHLSQLRNYNYNYSSNHSINKKLENNLVDQTHGKPEKLVGPGRARPKRAPSSSNPHEFYYYSGFGPRWGKKRGGVSKNNDDELDMFENVENDDESGSLELYRSGEEIDYEDDDEENEGKNGEKRKKKARKPIKERSLKSLM